MLAGLTRLATVQADASYGSPTSERPSGMSWMSTENVLYSALPNTASLPLTALCRSNYKAFPQWHN